MEYELWIYADEIENEYRDLDFDEFEEVIANAIDYYFAA